MTRSFPTLAAFVILSCSVSAQWPSHQTSGIPRGPDGKPNPAAPAPRTPDGKPDLSGVWMTNQEPDAAGRPPQVRGGYAGAGFKEGLPFQPWAADLQKRRAAEGGLNDPDGLCLPQGPLQVPRRPAATEDRADADADSHHLRVELRPAHHLHGRPPPAAAGQPQPFWHGYSVGHWEGDTLVVESNNFKGVDPASVKGVEPASLHGVGWLDHRGSPYTEAMTVTERFRRVNYGHLDIEFTVDDPKAYTRPFTVRVNQGDRARRLGADRIHLSREPDVPQAHGPRPQVAWNVKLESPEALP